jgi:hypothetical protein
MLVLPILVAMANRNIARMRRYLLRLCAGAGFVMFYHEFLACALTMMYAPVGDAQGLDLIPEIRNPSKSRRKQCTIP